MFQRLDEIADKFIIYAVCEGYRRCGRDRLLDMAALLASDPDMTVGDLRRRLRCTRCGLKSRSIRIIPLASCGPGWDPPRTSHRTIPPVVSGRHTAAPVLPRREPRRGSARRP